MDMFADRMARRWASIERAMKIANRIPAFRPQVELLLNNYFDFVDSMAVVCEQSRQAMAQRQIAQSENRRPAT